MNEDYNPIILDRFVRLVKLLEQKNYPQTKQLCILCNKITASFNYEGYKSKFCRKCSDPKMINVRTKKCENCNSKQPSFGTEYGKPKWCYNCSLKYKDSFDVIHKKCEDCNGVRPSFGTEIGKPKWCQKCSLEHKESFDVINKKCEDCNDIQPNFGTEIGKPKWCQKCSLDHDGSFNVISKLCEDCNLLYPCFGTETGKPPRWCQKCSLNHDGSFDVINKMCEDCNEVQCIFGTELGQPKWCKNCSLKHDDSFDVINKKCINCNIVQVKNPKYRGHCIRCFIHLFPNEEVSRNYKIKEKHVEDFIKHEFEDEDFIFDKVIYGPCPSKRRPDIFLDKFTHTIIIETDENQHQSYDTLCEHSRMMDIFRDCGKRPIVFIRFNPDSYINKNNKKISSCFKIHKTNGICIIDNKNKLNERLKVLSNNIKTYIENIPEKEVTVIELFYDNY